MSLGVTLTLTIAFLLGGLGLSIVYLRAKAEHARRTREDLGLLVQERRPSLDHTLERLGQDRKRQDEIR